MLKGEKLVVEKYGIPFDADASPNEMNIELLCYRYPEIYKTGHPVQYHFKKAFRLMWPEKVFQWNDWVEIMCWAWCNYRTISIMGCTRAGKTFNTAHFALLDYLAAPLETSGIFATQKFDSLKTRLWGDFLIAIRNSTARDAIESMFKTVSNTNELKFTPRGVKADEKFLIQGTAMDRGDESAGKIRGLNTPRRTIVGDEADNIPSGFYMALKHALAAPTLHAVLLTNPVEKNNPYGDFTRPKGGWGTISDTTKWWETETGVALHLDGRDSPNIKARKVVNPHLLTEAYFRSLKIDTVEYWMFGVGFFPPDGMVAKIWPSATLEKATQPQVFDYATEQFATLDPAFDADDCVIHFGEFGRLRDNRHCANFLQTFVIDVQVGPGKDEKDYQIAHECIRMCRQRGVAPKNFIMDMSGNGRGVYAIMRKEWGEIEGISYGGEATNRPLRLDDSLGANEQVRYFVSELWFRASNLAREGMICGLRNLDPKTIEDLDARRYMTRQYENKKVMVAETKDEMKKRLGRSPDYGDSASQVGELMVRKGMLGGATVAAPARGWDTMRRRAIRAQGVFEEEFASSHG